MTTVTALLATLTDRAPGDLQVMRGGHCVGTAESRFAAADIQAMRAGASQGVDQQRGAYEWWPILIRGMQIGELRDDASGYTIHLTASNARLRLALQQA